MVTKRRMYVAESIASLDSTNQCLFMTIAGPPVSQPRPRVRRMASRVVIFNPCSRNKAAYQKALRQSFREIGVTQFPIFSDDELKVVATFHVTNTRKDIDNLLKFILDVMQGIVYGDDRFVFSAEIHKKPAVSVAPGRSRIAWSGSIAR